MGEVLFTGSRVYGTPRDDSDLDIVVLCSEAEASLLLGVLQRHPNTTTRYEGSGAVSAVAGRVNYIIVNTRALFDAWSRGTARCLAVAPVDRETAKAIFIEEGVSREGVRRG